MRGVFGQRREKKALAQWQAQRDGYADFLQTAQTFNGTGSTDLMLAPGEAVFYKVIGTSLIEERRTGGHYQGRSSGVSIPVGLGVRYRTGGTRGHYVQGTPTPTAIDTGTVYITNKRVIFQGARQTRECAFAKLIGFQHSVSEGSTTFSVSNRQKPTTIHYGPSMSGAFDFRLDLALAHFRGTVGEVVARLQADLARIDASRPLQAPQSQRELQTLARSVAAWTDGPGGQAFHALIAAINDLDKETKAGSGFAAPALRLWEAVKAGKMAPPIPDADAQASWRAALNGLTDCIGYLSDALEARANESLRESVDHIGEMGRRLKAISAEAFGAD